LVDTPRDLLNATIPRPKPTEFPLVPLIENCVETLCVPISNRVGFTTPSQRIAANYSQKCDIVKINYKSKKVVISQEFIKDHKLHLDTKTYYEKLFGIQMLLSTQDQNEVTYNRFKMSLDRYNT